MASHIAVWVGVAAVVVALYCSDCAVPFVRVCSSGGHHSVLVCSVLVSADLHCHRCSRSLRIKIVNSKPCWPIAEAVVNYTHISCWYWYCNACCTIYTSRRCVLWRQPLNRYLVCGVNHVEVIAVVFSRPFLWRRLSWSVRGSWSSLLLTHGLLPGWYSHPLLWAVVFVFVFVM